jgi:hypothetical protein
VVEPGKNDTVNGTANSTADDDGSLGFRRECASAAGEARDPPRGRGHTGKMVG